jgi:hypothetical protein
MPPARREISRFPFKERLHMPGSLTTPGRPSTCVGALDHVAFRHHNGVSAQDIPIAAQWLAYAIPYRRFTDGLAAIGARLGADAGRYSFIVSDFHRLLLAGLPAHYDSNLKIDDLGAFSRCERNVGSR